MDLKTVAPVLVVLLLLISPSVSSDNLGEGYSGPTGPNAYSGACYPSLSSFSHSNPVVGRDDSVSVFVGRNYNGIEGAEVEGNVVVLGNLTVQRNGPGTWVSIGYGLQIVPNSGGDCIIVGEDLTARREIQVFNKNPNEQCDVVYKGTAVNPSNWKTLGSVRRVPDYDLTAFIAKKNEFEMKSQFWKTLPANGQVTELYTTTTFYCDNTNNVQVFRINKGDRAITAATSYRFSANCERKTILINVLGGGNIGVNAAAMYDYNSQQVPHFDTCLVQSILWNFPDANNVDIGNGWSSEFQGSILVTGNLELTTTGHSGRTIVVGDLTHERSGSELHSYPFNPPTVVPPIPPPPPPPTPSPLPICVPDNLGDGFSGPTGPNAYSGACYPSLSSFSHSNPVVGRDDSVSLFVGGDYNGIEGAEVEGNVVVIGDLTVQRNGPGTWVSIGYGSQIVPNSGGDCIIVGGDLTARREIQVFNKNSNEQCDVVYRGTAVNPSNWKTLGSVRRVPDYDLTAFIAKKNEFEMKSQFWKTLPANGQVTELYTTTTFYCDNTNNVQVFRINKDDRAITAATSYRFSANCERKTILINVLGGGNIGVNAAAMYDYNGRQVPHFDTCLVQSILWNFPDANNVDIGNGWTSEFQGSILVTGNLEFTTTGHSGRVIVVGDFTHERSGSELHSYPFNPPTELPC